MVKDMDTCALLRHACTSRTVRPCIRAPARRWASGVAASAAWRSSVRLHALRGSASSSRLSPFLCAQFFPFRAYDKDFDAGLLRKEYKRRLDEIGFEFNGSLAYNKRLESEKTAAHAHVKGLAYQLCSESEALKVACRGDVVWASLADDSTASASPEHREETCAAPAKLKGPAYQLCSDREGLQALDGIVLVSSADCAASASPERRQRGQNQGTARVYKCRNCGQPKRGHNCSFKAQRIESDGGDNDGGCKAFRSKRDSGQAESGNKGLSDEDEDAESDLELVQEEEGGARAWHL